MKQTVIPKDLAKQDWFKSLTDDCDAIITESVFNSRWALVEGYHLLGKRLVEESDKLEITALVKEVALTINKSERTLFYAVQFVRKYPELDKVPEGKNITWVKIITNYLGDGKKKELEGDHRHEWLTATTCRVCGKTR